MPEPKDYSKEPGPKKTDETSKSPSTANYLKMATAAGLRVGGPWVGGLAGAAASAPAGPEAVPFGAAGGRVAGGLLAEYLAEKFLENNGGKVNPGRMAISGALSAVPGNLLVRAGNPLYSGIAGATMGYAGSAGNKIAEGEPVSKAINPANWSGADLALSLGVPGLIGTGLSRFGVKPPAEQPGTSGTPPTKVVPPLRIVEGPTGNKIYSVPDSAAPTTTKGPEPGPLQKGQMQEGAVSAANEQLNKKIIPGIKAQTKGIKSDLIQATQDTRPSTTGATQPIGVNQVVQTPGAVVTDPELAGAEDTGPGTATPGEGPSEATTKALAKPINKNIARTQVQQERTGANRGANAEVRADANAQTQSDRANTAFGKMRAAAEDQNLKVNAERQAEEAEQQALQKGQDKIDAAKATLVKGEPSVTATTKGTGNETMRETWRPAAPDDTGGGGSNINSTDADGNPRTEEEPNLFYDKRKGMAWADKNGGPSKVDLVREKDASGTTIWRGVKRGVSADIDSTFSQSADRAAGDLVSGNQPLPGDDEKLFQEYLTDAKSNGYTGDDGSLRNQFQRHLGNARDLIQEMDQPTPHQNLFNDIAEAGGLGNDKGYQGEVDRLWEGSTTDRGTANNTGKGGRALRGGLGGVKGVLNRKSGKDLDGIVEALQQKGSEYQNIKTPNDLLAAIDAARTAKPGTTAPSLESALAASGAEKGQQWWTGKITPEISDYTSGDAPETIEAPVPKGESEPNLPGIAGPGGGSAAPLANVPPQNLTLTPPPSAPPTEGNLPLDTPVPRNSQSKALTDVVERRVRNQGPPAGITDRRAAELTSQNGGTAPDNPVDAEVRSDPNQAALDEIAAEQSAAKGGASPEPPPQVSASITSTNVAPIRFFNNPLNAAGSGYGDIVAANRMGETVPEAGRKIAGQVAGRMTQEAADNLASGNMTSDDFTKLDPAVQSAVLRRLRGQSGAIDPKLVASLGTGTAGALVGAATNKDDRLKGALVGGALGAAVPYAGAALYDNLPTLDRTPNLMRGIYLLDPSGLPANTVGAPTGLMTSTAAEKILPRLWGGGSPLEAQVGQRLLGSLPQLPKRTWDIYRSGQAANVLEHSPTNVTEMLPIDQAKTPIEKMATIPASLITSGHMAAQDMGINAGMSPNEAANMALAIDPAQSTGNKYVLKLGQGLQAMKTNREPDPTTGNVLANLIAPFTRTGSLVAAETPSRLPFGSNFLFRSGETQPVSNDQLMARTLYSSAVTPAAYELGKNLPPQYAPYARKWVRNLSGKYGLIATAAFEAGQASQKGEDPLAKGASAAITGVPMPTNEIPSDIAKAGVNLLEGNPVIPRSFIPNFMRETDNNPNGLVPKDYSTH